MHKFGLTPDGFPRLLHHSCMLNLLREIKLWRPPFTPPPSIRHRAEQANATNKRVKPSERKETVRISLPTSLMRNKPGVTGLKTASPASAPIPTGALPKPIAPVPAPVASAVPAPVTSPPKGQVPKPVPTGIGPTIIGPKPVLPPVPVSVPKAPTTFGPKPPQGVVPAAGVPTMITPKTAAPSAPVPEHPSLPKARSRRVHPCCSSSQSASSLR